MIARLTGRTSLPDRTAEPERRGQRTLSAIAGVAVLGACLGLTAAAAPADAKAETIIDRMLTAIGGAGKLHELRDAAGNRTRLLEERLGSLSDSAPRGEDFNAMADSLSANFNAKLEGQAMILGELESTVNNNASSMGAWDAKLKAVGRDMAMGIHETQNSLKTIEASFAARADAHLVAATVD